MSKGIKHTECYLVNISYQDESGNWNRDLDEFVAINLDGDKIPGSNQLEAENKVKSKYLGCIVHSITLHKL